MNIIKTCEQLYLVTPHVQRTSNFGLQLGGGINKCSRIDCVDYDLIVTTQHVVLFTNSLVFLSQVGLLIVGVENETKYICRDTKTYGVACYYYIDRLLAQTHDALVTYTIIKHQTQDPELLQRIKYALHKVYAAR